MVQGDANSRTIVATLWDGAQLYSIPAGAAIMVRFRKPDGTGGLYDATESGSEVSYAGSIVTAPVATQMLAVAGDVFAEIDIFGGGAGTSAERLATFRFVVEVAPCVLPDAEIISSDYYNVLAADIADAKAAADLAKDYAAAAKQSADSAATSVEGAVKYNVAQTLTDAQKQQARDNINATAPYTAGENISISGSVIATKAFPCNPNLLDNWYFGNPVNQRDGRIVPAGTPYFVAGSSTQVGVLSSPATVIGYLNSGGLYPQVKVGSETFITPIKTDVSGYVGAGYGIDRWKLDIGESVTIDNGLNIVKANSYVGQYFDDFDKFIGRQLVGSVLMSDGDLYTGTFVYNGVVNQGQTFFASSRLGMYIQKLSNALTQVEFNTLVDNVKVLAVGLELGSQQTLAHQDANGAWVLNEIPDYGEQLRRCQRYYQRLKASSGYMRFGISQPYTDTAAGVFIPLQGEMRTAPTMSSSGNFALFAGSAFHGVNLSLDTASPYNVTLKATGTGLPGTSSQLLANADTNAYIEFSADL
nr:MAG TPA: tail protein [Caudoviricetes sp.]